MIGDIHEGFGGIDVLVNNAGVLVVGAFVGMRHKDYRDMVETNLHGLFNVSKLSLPYLMKKKNGVVVNVSSSMAYRPMGVDQAVYAATEAGIIGFTRSMAHECAALGVRVNAIAPGLVDTGMIQDLGAPAIEGLIAKIGNARIASPNEVASLVVFLATPQASLISGQTLVADSGSVSFQF
jgi:3-oxoacyl-[acyl-carrier protein] reductase